MTRMSNAHDLAHYRWVTTLPTRWADNDMFGHVNNAAYYVLIDTALGQLLTQGCHFDPISSPYINVVLKNQCHYLSSLRYPDEVKIGVSVEKIGRSSVTYEVGLFRNSEQKACAVASVIEVWLDRATQESIEVPTAIRQWLDSLMH